MVSPADMIALGDSQLRPDQLSGHVLGAYYNEAVFGWGCGAVWAMAGIQWPPGTTGLSPDVLAMMGLTNRRHGGRFNMLFCDGHVERLSAANAFDWQQARVMRRWYRDNQPHLDYHP